MCGYGGKRFGGKTKFSKRKNALLTGSVFSAAIFTAFAFLFLFFPFIVRGNGRFSNEFYAERTAQAAGIETREYFPAGVCVCGVDVGGKEKRAAFGQIRAEERRRIPCLYADTAEGTEIVSPCEIGFNDDLEEIFSRAERGGRYETKMRCRLFGEGAERLIAAAEIPVKNARVIFDKNGFSYEREKDGVLIDREKFSRALESALSSLDLKEHGYEFPRLDMRKYARTARASFTMKDALKCTEKLASYTTEYSSSGGNRCRNIELAASFLNGVTLEGGEALSFNKTVGERTAARGFKEAKIIQSGEFISGVGGGVCQASTTLFNAALLSGLNVTERRNHSLSVSYVPASRDAAVSSRCDLKIVNPFAYPVYLRAVCAGKRITVTFYGTRSRRTYALCGKITGRTPPPEAEEKKLSAKEAAGLPADGEGRIWLRAPKEGIKSVLYRETYENGRLICREKLFSDSYAPVRGIYGVAVKKAEVAAGKTEENGEEKDAP